jgi:hypothetical protein
VGMRSSSHVQGQVHKGREGPDGEEGKRDGEAEAECAALPLTDGKLLITPCCNGWCALTSTSERGEGEDTECSAVAAAAAAALDCCDCLPMSSIDAWSVARKNPA